MVRLIEKAYKADDIYKIILKSYEKTYAKDLKNQYGISKEEIKQYANEKALKRLSVDGFTEDDLQEVANFLSSLKYPITLYRGITQSDKSKIRTGKDSGICWTLSADFIANQTHLGKFNFVMLGEFNESDINMEETIINYLHYSGSNRKQYKKEPEMEITIKKGKEPKNIEIVTIDEFRDEYM